MNPRAPIAHLLASIRATGRLGGIYPGVKYVMNSMFVLAGAKGVKVIMPTAEVGEKWGRDGPIFYKFEVKGVNLIHKICALSLLMVPGYAEYHGAPRGIVLKEALGLSKWEDGRLVAQRRIPPKLPRATLAAVYQYLKTPANYVRLKPQEIPTKEELDTF